MIIRLLIGLVLTLNPTADVLDDARTALENLERARSKVERGLERTEEEGRELSELLQVASAPLPGPPLAIEMYPDEGPDELKLRFEAWADHVALIERRATASKRSGERETVQTEVFGELGAGAAALEEAIAAAERAFFAVDQGVTDGDLEPADAATALGLGSWSQAGDKLAEARTLGAGLPERIAALLSAEKTTLTGLSKVEAVDAESLSVATIQRDSSEILMSVILMERRERDALVEAGSAGIQAAIDRTSEDVSAITDLEQMRRESGQQWEAMQALERARVARTPPARDDFVEEGVDADVRAARSDLAWREALILHDRETLELVASRRASLESLHERMVAGVELVQAAGRILIQLRVVPQARALLVDPTGASPVEYPLVAGQDAWEAFKSVVEIEARRTLAQEELERWLATDTLRKAAAADLEVQIETAERARRRVGESEANAALMAEVGALADNALLAELRPNGSAFAALQVARREEEARGRELAQLEAELPNAIEQVVVIDTPYAQRQITLEPGRTPEIRSELEALGGREQSLLPVDTSNSDEYWMKIELATRRPAAPPETDTEEELLSPTEAQLKALRGTQRTAQESLTYYLRLEAGVAALRATIDAYEAKLEDVRDTISARLFLERRLHAARSEVERRRRSGTLPDARVQGDLVSSLSLEEIAELSVARDNLAVTAVEKRGILRDELKRQALILDWKPWAEVGDDVGQQGINLISQPVFHVEAARRTVEELPDFERGNLEYTAHQLVLAERSSMERVLAPLTPLERRGHFDATLEAYYLAVVNLERIGREYGKAQESYRQLIELYKTSREGLRGALEAMRDQERMRLLDYREDLVFAAIAANPTRRIRIMAEYGQDLPVLLDDRDSDLPFWADTLAGAEGRLWGARVKIANLVHQLSREGIESDINAFAMHIAHIGTEVEEKEALAAQLRTRIEELRSSYRVELRTNALWTLFKVSMIPLLAILAVRGLRRLSMRIRNRAKGVVGSPDRKRRLETLTNVSTAAIRSVVWVLAGIYMLAFLGLDITPIIASASVVGLAVAFGAQALVKDFFAGFFLLLEHQYSVGDVVDLGIASGKVEHISLRMTTLRDLKGVVHYVPNGLVQRVANKTKGWSQIIMEVGVPYGEDIDRVTAILQEELDALAADEDLGSNILGQPTVAGVEALGESRIDLRLMVKVLPGEQWGMARELRRRIRRRFDAEGIKAPFPRRIVHHLDEDPPTAQEAKR